MNAQTMPDVPQKYVLDAAKRLEKANRTSRLGPKRKAVEMSGIIGQVAILWLREYAQYAKPPFSLETAKKLLGKALAARKNKKALTKIPLAEACDMTDKASEPPKKEIAIPLLECVEPSVPPHKSRTWRRLRRQEPIAGLTDRFGRRLGKRKKPAFIQLPLLMRQS
jgi:hypothetical protein